MSGNNKVTKFRKRKYSLNIGIIVFLFVFAYIIINLIISSTKQTVAIAQVEKGYIVDNAYYSGIIMRNEELVYNSQSGYVNYMKSSGKKVGVNDSVYIVDPSGTLYSQAAVVGGVDTLEYTTSDYNDLNDIISSYRNGSSDSNYSNVYSLKFNLQNKISEMISGNILYDLSKLPEVQNQNYATKNAEKSGIVCYTYDGLEGISVEHFDEDNFDRSTYKRNQLVTNSYVASGDPVYRLVTNNEWNIVIKVSNELAQKLSEKKFVTVRLRRDDITTTAAVQVFQRGSQCYMALTLNRYMIEYINDRFIDIEIVSTSAKGYKIPTSSLVNKDFYRIPNNYVFKDDTDGNSYVIKKSGGTGEKYKVTIYSSNDNYSYVDLDAFKDGDVLASPDGSASDFTIQSTGSLEGVYNVNRGYAMFRLVDIVYKTDSYTIIKSGTSYGLSLYDRIVLNGTTVEENQIIN